MLEHLLWIKLQAHLHILVSFNSFQLRLKYLMNNVFRWPFLLNWVLSLLLVDFTNRCTVEGLKRLKSSLMSIPKSQLWQSLTIFSKLTERNFASAKAQFFFPRRVSTSGFTRNNLKSLYTTNLVFHEAHYIKNTTEAKRWNLVSSTPCSAIIVQTSQLSSS